MADRIDIGHVDFALQKLGPFGRYTLVQFSMQILAQFAIATHTLSIVFTGQKNPFRCTVPDSKTQSDLTTETTNLYTSNFSFVNTSQLEYDSLCHHSGFNTSDCKAHEVEYQLDKNLYFVSEFDLVCNREFFAGLAQTLLTLGLAIGSLVFPYFADNYGRKPVLLICSFLWFGSSMGLAFSVNYTMLAVFKTFVGIFLQGVSQTSVTFIMEILTRKQRGPMFGCLGFIFWTLSIMLMAPVAYGLRYHTWRYLELAFCTYFIYIILFVLFMDESLRWLAANGLKDRVLEVLKKASSWNHSNLGDVVSAFYTGTEKDICKDTISAVPPNIDVKPDNFNFVEKLKEDLSSDKSDSTIEACALKENCVSDKKLNCTSLFTNRFLRNSTLFSMCSWFFNSLTYYALFLMSSTLSGSLYLNYFLNCVVEIPSAIFIYFFIDRLGRKICFSAFSLTAGISLVVAAILSSLFREQLIAIKAMTIIGKFGISGSYGTIYIMTPELFPTNVRTTGLGLANMSACLGGMLAPFAELLMKIAVVAPGLIFGIGSLVLSGWAFFLYETANRELPQSVMDIQAWSTEPKKGGKCAEQISKSAEQNSHVNAAFTSV